MGSAKQLHAQSHHRTSQNHFSQSSAMPKELTWDDAEQIGIRLSEKHPEADPLALGFTELHRYVTELSEFKDDPRKSDAGRLEAIQMAWHAEFLDRTQ
jgi:FeS assembly protein IscX